MHTISEQIQFHQKYALSYEMNYYISASIHRPVYTVQ